jgi:hypothetical protein
MPFNRRYITGEFDGKKGMIVMKGDWVIKNKNGRIKEVLPTHTYPEEKCKAGMAECVCPCKVCNQ